MSDNRDEQVMKLVDQVIELDAAQRDAFLDAACAGDLTLRADVERLLRNETRARAVFDAGAQEIRNLPAQIGPYRLLEVIGEGGMGVVWRAEQREPITRIVAIKLIKLGMDTKAVIARFESERQALAIMNHPNVATVYDAGTTPAGRPYFVMEFVAGEAITAFCDRHHYSVRQRLELFLQACEAVQHAHTKAILHRDLKPSNILVTLHNGKPLVKVIDFGIAKATAQQLTERTFFTETGQMIGTPEYMSPEQAEMIVDDIDTRSDVYSLGVVLYELLIGALPIDAKALRSAGYREIQRKIIETEAPRPSTRLSTLENREEIATRRQTAINDLTSLLRGELEWIPLKALRKDRAQRYTTADQFAEDIRNYLSHKPLIAGPESAAYRAKKFLRRNRGPVIAASLVVAALLAGIASTSIALVGQSHARREAELQKTEAVSRREEAEAVTQFLTDDVLAGARPERLGDKAVRDTIVKTMLDPAAATVHERFESKPPVEAAVRRTLGRAYHDLGRDDLSATHARAAYDAMTAMLGADHPRTLAQASTLVWALDGLAKFDEAEVIARKALDGLRRARGNDHPDIVDALGALCKVLYSRGKFADVDVLAREAVERSRRVRGPEHSETLALMDMLAGALMEEGKMSEAEPFQRAVLEIARRKYGNDHADTLMFISNLSTFLSRAGKKDEALVLAREALDGRLRVLGELHPNTLTNMINVANIEEAQGNYDAAETWYRRALDGRRKLFGDDHPETLKAMSNLGLWLVRRQRLAEAEPLLTEALEKCRRVLGDDHPNTLVIINQRAFLYVRAGKLKEAEPLLREAVAHARRTLGDGHPNTFTLVTNLGEVLEQTDQLDEAQSLYEEVFRRAPAVQMDPRVTARNSAHYGLILFARKRDADAESPLKEGLRRLRDAKQIASPQARNVLTALATICDRSGRVDEAKSYRSELNAITSASQPSAKPSSQPTSRPASQTAK
jgi:non-specific serine/threonine protein kinase/serine/threonine-protein kinase